MPVQDPEKSMGETKRRILIIDDQDDFTQSLKLGLQYKEMDADAYTDPVEAVKDYEPGRYDLVLLDMQMPRMNGFQVYRELRRIDKDAKICFLTAFEVHENEFKKLFPEVKVQKFLTKPISLDRLTSEIEDAIMLDGKAEPF